MNKIEHIRSLKAQLEVRKKERADLEGTTPSPERENTIEYVSNKIDALEKQIAEAESPH